MSPPIQAIRVTYLAIGPQSSLRESVHLSAGHYIGLDKTPRNMAE
jgi:hypothetical protein